MQGKSIAVNQSHSLGNSYSCTFKLTDTAVNTSYYIFSSSGMKLTGTSSYMWSVTLNGDGNKAFVQKFPAVDALNGYKATNSAFNTEKMVRCVKKVTLE